MKRILFAVLMMIVIPIGAFAVDGVVLVNQSTVMAGGGFPYVISQPGSYKLTGNLVLNTTQQGNFNGTDIAIVINSNNVALDLNGFTITVNDSFGQTLGHPFYGTAEARALNQVSIRNGMIRVSTNTNRVVLHAIFFPTSLVLQFEDLNLVGLAPILDVAPPQPILLRAGSDSLVRHVVAPGAIQLGCPSLAIDNIGFVSPVNNADSCIIVNNSKSLVIPLP